MENKTDNNFIKSLLQDLGAIPDNDEKYYALRDLGEFYGMDELVADIIERKKTIGKTTTYLKLIRQFHSTEEFGFVDLAEVLVSGVKWSLSKGKSLQSCAIKVGDKVISCLGVDDSADSLAVRNKRRFKIGDWLMVSLRVPEIINYKRLFTGDDIKLLRKHKAIKASQDAKKLASSNSKVKNLFFKTSLMVIEGDNLDCKDILKKLYLEIDNTKTDYKTYPRFEVLTPYSEFYNEDLRSKMIKGLTEEQEKYFTLRNCPLVFDAFNYVQETNFKVDGDLLNWLEAILSKEKGMRAEFIKVNDIATDGSRDKSTYELTLEHLRLDLVDLERDELKRISELLLSPKQHEKAVESLKKKLKRKNQGIDSMLIEINETLKMAKKTHLKSEDLGEGFPQHAFGDYRLRMYFKTSFLHNQGSKMARSLLNMDKGKALTPEGYDKLLISAAGNFGLDKKPQKERLEYAKEQLDFWILAVGTPFNPDYAELWEKADNAMAFRGDLLELKRAIDYENEEPENSRFDYVSTRLVYLDYCTSLIMIMSAMMGDEEGLKWSNCVDNDLRHDSYERVAEISFAGIVFGDKEQIALDKSIVKLKEIHSKAKEAGTLQTEKVKQQLKYRRSVIKDLQASRFWSDPKFDDPKLRRKLVKRGVMLVFYGGGLGASTTYLIKENEFDVDFALLNTEFAKWLARRIRIACAETFPGAMACMGIINRMAEIKFDKGEDFVVTEPLTLGRMHLSGKSIRTEQQNSSFTRHIVHKDGKKLYYATEQENSSVTFPKPRVVIEEISLQMVNAQIEALADSPEDPMKRIEKLDRLEEKKAKMRADVVTASVTAIIHFIDALILRIVILGAKEAGYLISVIHDSIGCLAANAGNLWDMGRKKFLETMDANLMLHFLDDPDFKGDEEIRTIIKLFYGSGIAIFEDPEEWESFMNRLTTGMDNEFNFC